MESAKFTYSSLGKAFEKRKRKQLKIKEKNKQKQFKIKEKLKQSKNILIVIKIVHWSEKQIEMFNKLVYERFEEITKLDKKS